MVKVRGVIAGETGMNSGILSCRMGTLVHDPKKLPESQKLTGMGVSFAP